MKLTFVIPSVAIWTSLAAFGDPLPKTMPKEMPKSAGEATVMPKKLLPRLGWDPMNPNAGPPPSEQAAPPPPTVLGAPKDPETSSAPLFIPGPTVKAAPPPKEMSPVPAATPALKVAPVVKVAPVKKPEPVVKVAPVKKPEPVVKVESVKRPEPVVKVESVKRPEPVVKVAPVKKAAPVEPARAVAASPTPPPPPSKPASPVAPTPTPAPAPVLTVSPPPPPPVAPALPDVEPPPRAAVFTPGTPEPLIPEKAEVDDDGAQEKLLVLSARIDGAYLAGTGIQQGFSVPSLRLVASGGVGDLVHYRLALGETREFSTAMLPQILPQDAYVALGWEPYSAKKSDTLGFRFGMFTPMQNPWWTYDLAYVDLPTYHQSQQAMLLPPDLGAELFYRPFGDHLLLGVSLFNGNGNYSLNVNGSKGVGGYAKLLFPVGRGRIVIGTGAYSVSQSAPGDTNYKSNWATDSFLSFEMAPLLLTFDMLTGTFSDATRYVSPFGGAGVLQVFLGKGVSLLTRLEELQNSPITGGVLQHAQFGPELMLNGAVKTWLLFDYLDAGDHAIERSVQARVRLTL